MAEHIVRETLTSRKERDRAMLECYRQLGSGMQDDILHTASLHLKHLKEMIQETGLDLESASDGFGEWIVAKARERSYSNG